MGYVATTKKWGTDQLLWNSLHLSDSALVLNDGNTLPIVMMVGGQYNVGGVTFDDGDAAVMQFTSDGKLMVDTELTVDGNVIVDNVAVWATNIADSSTSGFALIDAAGHPQVDIIAGALGPAPAVTNATGAGAIATSTTIADNFRLVGITVNFDAAPTTSENLTVTLNANDGAAYDTVLFSIDPSATSATDIVYIPDKELIFESGDEIDVAFANTDTNTYGLRIVTQVI
jgi:hypothetical protein|tara:strand:- start:197 stop:883 length:687 start_codon:yes stop_codon:yes gene_type:complete